MSESRAGAQPRGGRGFDRGGRNNRRDGGAGRGGRYNNNRGNAPKYQSKTPAIKNFIIDHGKAEHAALLVKHKKEIIEFIRREGEDEATLIADALETGMAPTIAVPPRPPRIENPDNLGAVPPDMIDDEAELIIWQGELKTIPSRRANLQKGLITYFSVILDQCVPTLRKKLEQLQDWPNIFAEKNPIRLFEEITNIVQGREEHQQPMYSLVQGLKLLFGFRQDGMSNSKYLECQDALYEALVQQGCDVALALAPTTIAEEAEIIADEVGRDAALRPHPDDVAVATANVQARFKACLGLSGADNRKHKALKDYLENSYSMGRDEYPGSTTSLLSLMENFRPPERPRDREQPAAGRSPPVPEEGVNFAQQGADGAAEPDGGATDDAEHGAQMLIGATMDTTPPSYADMASAMPPRSNAGVKSTKRLICCACGSTEHNLDSCPDVSDEMLAEILLQLEEVSPEGTGTVMIQNQRSLGTKDKTSTPSGLLSNLVYLDTCTTNDIMANPAYLSDLKSVDKPLTMHTNAGSTRTYQQGMLGKLKFWVCPHGIANVVSLRTLEKHFRVTYDSTKDGGSFTCSTPHGSITFKRCPKTGFPYIDLDDEDSDAAFVMVQSIRENFDGFTRQEVERAITARRAQGLAGHPSERVFKQEVSRKSNSSLFRSCPITAQDITNARTIFGPSVPCARGKWVRGKTPRVEPGYVSIPANLLSSKYLTLAADVMFVCGLPFLVTLSRKIRFVTIQYVPRRSAKELANGLKNVQSLYARAGFIVQTALMDGEFEKVRDHLLHLLTVNICSRNEHVPEIERKIRHIKERCRCTKSELKPALLIIVKHLVLHSVMFLNAYPDSQGISSTYSPREIVLRWQLDFKTHCRVPFGAYCLVYDDPDPSETNTMQPRARFCICLGPTGNFQGTYKFLCLDTKSVIKRKRFDEYPMPDSVIKSLERWGKRDKQSGRLTFGDRHNIPFSWDEEYELRPLLHDNAVEPETPSLPFPDLAAEHPGVLYENESPTTTLLPDPEAPAALIDQEAADAAASLENANFGPREADLLRRAEIAGVDREPAAAIPNVYNVTNNNINVIPAADNEFHNANDDDIDEQETASEEEETPADDSAESDEDYDPNEESSEEEHESLEDEYGTGVVPEDEALEDEPTQSRRSGRERRPPKHLQDYDVTACKIDDEDRLELTDDDIPYFGIMLIQMSLKQGLKVFGKRGEEGAMREMQQLHDMETFFPRDPRTLTREERIKALSSLIFLKEKSSGEVKGRTCVNGAPQRAYIRKEDAHSPTVMTDSIFIQGTINAQERRKTGKADLPGAFLHTVTDEKVIMVLRGELCELMVKVNPKLYRKYVMHTKRGVPVLYVELYKSLYGLMRSALLFYWKLKKELIDYGFKINPYDACVANKMTKDGKQLTVMWHVDDLQASCVHGEEITKLFLYLKRIYGDKMTIDRSDQFEFLGMNLDYSEPGVFGVDMSGYIDTILADWPEAISRGRPCPHNGNLFKVRLNGSQRYLPEEQAVKFHHTVAQLQFLQKRARRDIHTACSFLASRVKQPDEDDWAKCRRVLEYLASTKSLKLRLVAKDLSEMKWLVDASHGAHWDCKGQTGAAMTLGEGAVISGSNKQRVNTKSACETELVGVDDYISTMLWSLYFMQEQGVDMERIRLYQDNKSTILLENNGKMSSSKRTKHIKAKYFFVTDKVEQGDIVIEHLPTEQMWCDMNTKPTEGARFKKDRAMHMNCPIDLPDEMTSKDTGKSANDKSARVHNDTPQATTSKTSRVLRNPVNKQDDIRLRLQECVGDKGFKLQVERAVKRRCGGKTYVAKSRDQSRSIAVAE